MKIKTIDLAVLGAARNAGHSDEAIEKMSARELFQVYCQWEGMIGWSDTLWQVVESLKEAESQSTSSRNDIAQPLMDESFVPVSKEAFHSKLRDYARARNTDSTADYDATTNLTRWIVAGRIVGQSVGRVGEGANYRLSPNAA